MYTKYVLNTTIMYLLNAVIVAGIVASGIATLAYFRMIVIKGHGNWQKVVLAGLNAGLVYLGLSLLGYIP